MQNHLRCAPDEVARGDIFIESVYEYDLSMGMFFDIMSHRSEIFAGFLEPVLRCNLLRSKWECRETGSLRS